MAKQENPPLTVTKTPLHDPVSQALIAELDAELKPRYPEQGATHFRLADDEVSEGRGAFLVAWLDGEAVACGAVRLIDRDTAEIKRMYVRPSARGRGVAMRVLQALEAEARVLGARRVVLETGERQHEALALYRRAGYAPTGRYGAYVDSPLSVCLARDLGAPDRLNEEVGVLTRREIEARIVGPLVEAFSERFGREATLEVLRQVVVAQARASGERMREAGDDSIEAFAAGWEPWLRGGALEIVEHARTADTWSFDVVRCRYAEMYRALGMADLGETLSCNRDGALCEGFSERLSLQRDQTIMRGAACCTFRYRRGR